METFAPTVMFSVQLIVKINSLYIFNVTEMLVQSNFFKPLI